MKRMESVGEKEREEKIVKIRVEQEGCSQERCTDADDEEIFFLGHGISQVSSESDWRGAFWQRLRGKGMAFCRRGGDGA